ncbi:hypothetical protein TPHA_0G02780 [Tetrapisispora phaffii CBS 4417]|uniref:Aspartate aminotransferase n=1 Tax=Tetrapisispora phaffii (strain ATCC 24235 / CBS 4417 / NBRC 1672 / NRRL Y-8282 / UCD 70-5) TaxID=1071381 RepID=G8BW38_TETPH|nr:hypothetical protein TPHA_0G02780 [Tetrapisispora phaffii CBS 4417]CCE64116.1 hypothetical protein TPHA_0G02780 [Tetrapisispora phaffii CBS 4417]
MFEDIPLLPADALFGIKQRYGQDDRALKVDLGIGAYRDNEGKPWVLPSVRKAEKLIHEDPEFNHEYLGITGLKSLTDGAAKVILGEDSAALKEDRVVSIQSLSGTGALHVSAKFFSKFWPSKKVYLSNPTWANHKTIYEVQGLTTSVYSYWDAASKTLCIDGFVNAIKSADEGSIFVLHACAHNPTGLDPTKEQWVKVIDALREGKHIALFDSAYQGFASGDLANDAYSVRLGVEKLSEELPIFICQSFAKNVGMYGERVGCFHIVLPLKETSKTLEETKAAISSQLARIIRSEVSNPPSYGAKIVAKILNNTELTQQWHEDMVTMSSRINEMREQLKNHLTSLGTPGTWNHITEQTGMFSFTGLTKEMVARLETNYGIYMVPNGRASIAGLNTGNVKYVATSIDETVRQFST